MELKSRIVRFAVALTIAGAIASQIPTNGVALAGRDGYGQNKGSGNTARNVIRGLVAGTVGYGLYTTATAPPTAGGGGGGGGTTPDNTVPPDDSNKKNQEAIWDVANGREDMNKFAQVADLAGIKEELRKAGEFTAFIPNNSAFTDLGDAKIQELSKPENKAKLTEMIGSHVLVGKFTIDQLKNKAKNGPVQMATINGKMVTIKFAGEILSINGVRIIESDIAASNGVIHPIGMVLDPSAPTTP